jgi:hypothetical protein
MLQGIESPDDEWPCQWLSCTTRFILESDLYTHLKEHTKRTQPLNCKWKGCSSTTVYSHKGHLNDHIICHMSKDFVSVQCPNCLTGFRNRQALTRHLRECRQSDHSANGADVLYTREATTALIEMVQGPDTLIETLIRGRSLECIIEQGKEGASFMN